MTRLPGSRDRLLLGAVTLLEAATFAAASVVHFGVSVLGIPGERFPGARIPEAVIAAVLVVGAAAVLAAPRHAWGWALGTHVFAAVGTVVGITVTFSGTGPASTGDRIYHVTILAVLVVMTAVLTRGRARRALRPGQAPVAAFSRNGNISGMA